MEKGYKILFLEDEETIREVLKEYMTLSGCEVTEAADGDEAIALLSAERFDIAVLDIMVPGTDGYGVLDFIRKRGEPMGVLMFTALDDEASQVRAFNGLADDYITKPASPILLLKRIEAVGRRLRAENRTMLSDISVQGANDRLVLDREGYTAYFDGKPLHLTLSEFLLLQTLYETPKRVFTREMLILAIYNEDYIGNDRIIDAHVKNLRKKLPVPCIRTVIGVGYQYDIKAGEVGA